MLFLEHAWRLHQSNISDNESWCGIPEAKRLKLAYFLIKTGVQIVQLYLGIYSQYRLQVFGPQNALAVRFKAAFEFCNPCGGQGKACRLCMAAKAVKELARIAQRIQQVKIRNRPGRSLADALRDSDNQSGAMVELHRALRHYSDNAAVPALT